MIEIHLKTLSLSPSQCQSHRRRLLVAKNFDLNEGLLQLIDEPLVLRRTA